MSLLAPSLLWAQALSTRPFSELVRLDLETGALIEARRADGPSRFEQVTLSTPLSLVGLRDEVIAFQIAVSGGPATAHATAGALIAQDGRRSEIVPELFVERAIVVERPSEGAFVHSLGAGAYPDVLIPTSTIHVPASPGVAVLWVDVWIPPQTSAGHYRGRIDLGPAPGLELELEVLEARLPERDAARLGAVNFGSFLEMHKADPARMLAWMQMMHAHHLSVDLLTPPPAPPPKEGGGHDWSAWSAMVGPYVDGRAFSRAAGYRGPREGLGVSRWVIPVTERWPAARTETKLPSDPEAWTQALSEWEAEVRDRAWFDRPQGLEWVLFINGLDEPSSASALEAIVSYAELIEAAQLSDRRHVSFRVDGPFGQGVEAWSDARILDELGRVADVWNLCGAPPWIPWPLLEARRSREPSERVMFYASSTAGEPSIGPLVVDAPLSGMRAWAWIVARYGLSGALNWEVDVGSGCVRKPTCTDAGLNLDATLIFRGEELGRRRSEPLASIRLKALRRGAQDAAILSLIAAQSPETARALAERVIPGDFGAPSEDGSGAWPKAPEDWARVTAAMHEHLGYRPERRALEPRGVDPWWPSSLQAGLRLVGVCVLVLVSIWGFWRFRRR